MKIAIIGAGVSGLTSIRKALEFGVECVAYEVSENIGGTWFYNENEDVPDELQDYVPANIYSSLKTNLPTALMEFRGYKFQPESGQCYPSHAEVLKYIENFARHFNLIPHIKFSHKVLNVSRQNEKWVVKVENLINCQLFEEEFDGVMVCSGHYTIPIYPSFPGMDTFLGHQIHSRKYRRNDFYKDKIVLLVGKGQSALDICRDVSRVAVKVFLSHRGAHLNIRPKNIFQKPNIVKIDKNLIFFEDGSTEFVEAIIHCTGYKYEFPCLDPSCGIISNNNTVLSPIYKYFINAKFPTMCIILLMKRATAFRLMDLQAEVFIKMLTGHVKMPSTEEMLSDIQKQYEEKVKANFIGPLFYVFESAEARRKYFQDLYDLGNCEPLPPVLSDILDNNAKCMRNNYDNLRNQVYEVIDDYTYKFQLKTEESKRTD